MAKKSIKVIRGNGVFEVSANNAKDGVLSPALRAEGYRLMIEEKKQPVKKVKKEEQPKEAAK